MSHSNSILISLPQGNLFPFARIKLEQESSVKRSCSCQGKQTHCESEGHAHPYSSSGASLLLRIVKDEIINR
jgi:hypothetical protein